MECITEDDIICKKHSIILRKTDIKNVYSLEFGITNDRIDLSQFLDWKIYELLYNLNKDILCDMKVFETDEKRKQIYYLFNRFGKDLGILQRYMHFNIDHVTDSESDTSKEHYVADGIEFRCTPIDDGKYSTKTCQPLKSNFSIFNMKLIDKTLHIKYVYHIDLQENLPSYMKNIAGILIKKLFWRVKTFIEKL